jgi:MOSC domain-containing protein YiiM
MTTLQQGDLPADPGILKTIAKYNNSKLGVNAEVLQGGTIHRGDLIRVE